MSPLNHLCYALVRLISWVILRVGFSLEVSGQGHVPKHGGCIIASNHLSFLDPNVIGTSCPRPVRFLARDTLFAHPLLLLYLRGVGVIPLRRGEADPSAVREAVRSLRRGECLAFFPEGTRQLSGTLGRAKRGVGLLACMAKVPIVPVLVHGTFEALPPDGKRLRRAKIRVAFGPPISYTDVLSATDASPPSPPGGGTSGHAGDRATRAYHQRLAEAVTRAWQRLEQQEHDRPSRARPV